MRTLDFGNGCDRKPGTINADIHLNPGIDFVYDGKELPLKSGVFDKVLSDQVMEHCMFIDDYYREVARVLKPEGVAQISFPHKFVPFDSHSRRWFRHWFLPGHHAPGFNWRSRGYHKRICRKYFKTIRDRSDEIKVNYSIYEGPRLLRKIASHIPFISYFRQVHWELKNVLPMA